jgi:hypothetical protein
MCVCVSHPFTGRKLQFSLFKSHVKSLVFVALVAEAFKKIAKRLTIKLFDATILQVLAEIS